MFQADMNKIFRRTINFLVDNIPGLALLIWTVVLILVHLDSIASTSYLLFLYYPFYSLLIWMVIGAFAQDKVWQTIKWGLIGHVILLGFVLSLLSTAEGGYYFALEFVALLVLPALVVLSALLSSVIVLAGSRFADAIRNPWFLWVILNVIGYGIGNFIGIYLAFGTFSGDSNFAASLVAGGMTGLIIGLVQWLLLRQVLKEAGWWILATGMGLTIGRLFAPITGSITGLWASSFTSAIIGFALGSVQWFVLRKQFDRASVWIIATMLGYAASHVVVGTGNFSPLFANLAQDILLGTITGGALIWLLQNYRLKSFQQSM